MFDNLNNVVFLFSFHKSTQNTTEVARTRLRQEGNVYRHFWQTLFLVFRQEGVAGLYRGLATQLVRQIPNTAIMMGVYELFMHGWTIYVIDDGETTHDY